MASHGSVAAKVRANKEKHPEFYCRVPGCLWRTVVFNGGTVPIQNPCKKHPTRT